MTERNRIYEESGLSALIDEVDLIDNAEYDAWKALVTAKPTNMAECAHRASYLLSIMQEDEKPRLAGWLTEFLGSLIEVETPYAT